MEKYFLEILHKGEVMNETSLEMLKGGFAVQLIVPVLHRVVVTKEMPLLVLVTKKISQSH